MAWMMRAGSAVVCADVRKQGTVRATTRSKALRIKLDLGSCIGPPGQQNSVEHAAFVFRKAGGSPRGNTYLQTGYLKDLDTDGQTTTSP